MELKLAAIDLGTVSSRLLCATVRAGRVIESSKHTVITDLGEGVDAHGVFAPAAIERVAQACAQFVDKARAFGAQVVCTTLTSAARDVSNGDDLLSRLRALGLKPQVIPGEIEARLTFYGVAHDFAGERIAVADSGGGSTEIVVGAYGRADAAFDVSRAESLNIGCRRVTERFFSSMPPAAGEIDAAVSWVRPQFDAYWQGLGGCCPVGCDGLTACEGAAERGADARDHPFERETPAGRPDRLIAVGGTVTSLVAMVHKLEKYDSHFVHLRDLTLGELDACIELMSSLDVAGIASLPGVQGKRAPVLLAGSLVIRELMRAGRYDRLTVSENSLLAGAAATIYEAVSSEGAPVIGWTPELSGL